MEETVGVWNMAVVPSHQRRGIGRVLLTVVLEHHQAAGVTVWTAAAGSLDETGNSQLT